MQVDPKTLAEYKRIYEKEFKEKITDQEAYEGFLRLINVLRIVYFPDKEDQ